MNETIGGIEGQTGQSISGRGAGETRAVRHATQHVLTLRAQGNTSQLSPLGYPAQDRSYPDGIPHTSHDQAIH